jgi:TolB protein
VAILRRPQKIQAPPANWIGYTEYSTSLPRGRHANQATMRAVMVKADGTDRRAVADELSQKPNTWTQSHLDL